MMMCIFLIHAPWTFLGCRCSKFFYMCISVHSDQLGLYR